MMNKIRVVALVLCAISCEVKTPTDTDAYVLEEKDLIPEGIAFSEKQDAFYLTSIYKRKIIRMDRKTGEVSDFIASEEYGFLAGLGVITNESKNELWALSGDIEEGLTQSLVFRFDLASGDLIKTYSIEDSTHRFFNDLTIDSKGTVYITDSNNQSIYTVSANDSLELFFDSEEIIYPNGICIAPDHKRLYIASAFKGIRTLDIATKSLLNPVDTTDATIAIDGLEWYNHSLIGIQNGFRDLSRHRIARYPLNETGNEVVDAETIDQNNPDLVLPTTHVVVGDAFYVIGNSQLERLDQASNKIIQPDSLVQSKVLRYRLITP